MNSNPHIGSSFDSFLEDEGTLADIETIALKRAIAWQNKSQEKAKTLKPSNCRPAKKTFV